MDKGDAAGVPDFTSRKAAEAWLRMQPHEACLAIAARAALRVLPLVGTEPRQNEEQFRREIILPLLHSTSISQFVATNAQIFSEFVQSRLTTEGARASDHAYSYPGADDTARAVFSAARHAAFLADEFFDYEVESASRAASSVAASARASAGQSVAGSFTALVAVAADAAIVSGASPEALAHAPLWPDGPPEWAQTSWTDLKSHLLAADEEWEVWTDWYEARLRGDPFDPDREQARVLIDEAIWQQGPKAVNAEIARLIAAHRTKAEALEAAPPPAPEPATVAEQVRQMLDSPALQTAYADFRIDAVDKRVRMVAMPGDLPTIADPVLALDWRARLEGLAYASAELLRNISKDEPKNVSPSFRRHLDQYAKEAKRPADDARPGVLDHLGSMLVAADRDAEIATCLGDYLASMLNGLATRHQAMMRDYHAPVQARMAAADAVTLPDDATPQAVAEAVQAVAVAVREESWGGLEAPEDFAALLEGNAEAMRGAARVIDMGVEGAERAVIATHLKRMEVSTLASISRMTLVAGLGTGMTVAPQNTLAVVSALATIAGFIEMVVPASVLPLVRRILRWMGIIQRQD